jgi:hypothetical protein
MDKNSIALADLVMPEGNMGGDIQKDAASSLLHLSI